MKKNVIFWNCCATFTSIHFGRVSSEICANWHGIRSVGIRRWLGRGNTRALSLETVVAKVCKEAGLRVQEVAGGGRRAVQSRVREGAAYLWIEWLGHSGPAAARAVGIRPEGVYRVAKRGWQRAQYWQRVLDR